MKKVFFVIVLLSYNAIFAQAIKNIQTDYFNLHRYVGTKSYNDLKAMYANPSSMHVDENYAFLVYESDAYSCKFSFDKDKKLSQAFISFKQNSNQRNELLDNFSSFTTIKNKEAIHKQLGTPSEIIIEGKNENWTYSISDNEKEQFLYIQFDNALNEIVNFDFNCQLNNVSPVIDNKILSALSEGETRAKDVKKVLGLPNFCKINSHNNYTLERWMYQTEKAQLSLVFDDKAILQSYTYYTLDK